MSFLSTRAWFAFVSTAGAMVAAFSSCSAPPNDTDDCTGGNSCGSAGASAIDAGTDAHLDAAFDALADATPDDAAPDDAGPCTCADDGNPCTDDVCDQGGQCIHPPKPAGVECRPSGGACDVAETCDGTGAACPKDMYDAACVCPFHGPIAGYTEHDGLRAIDASHFVLVDTGTWASYATMIDGLGLPYVPLDALDLNRTGTKPDAALAADLATVAGYAGAFEWTTGDQNVAYWVPQGLTGGTAGARNYVVVSWHYDEANIATDPNPPVSGSDKGVRVSFADVSTMGGDVLYRHVLLVEPEAQNGFVSVNIHAGGLALYGPYLYVADTSKGVRVFDTTRIMDVSTAAECSSRIGKSDGNICAYGYAYALPQVGGFYYPAGLPAACRPKFSFLSLDRTTSPHSLVSGEYDNDTVTGIYSRLLRWPLDEVTRRLATDGGGAVRATGAWYAGNRNVQGAASIAGKFFLNATRYSGALFTGKVDQASKVYRASQGQWGWMPEGIHHWPESGRLWVNTEGHLNMPRLVYAVTASQVP